MWQVGSHTIDARWVRRLRTATAMALDAVAWPVGVVAAVGARFEFALRSEDVYRAVLIAVFAAMVHATCRQAWQLVHGRHGYATFEDIRAVALSVAVTATFVLAVDLALTPRPIPASCALTGGLVALTGMVAARCVYRELHDRNVRPSNGAERALLFGAGETGHALTRAMLRDRRSPYLPVGLIDDDRSKRYLRVHGVPILGGRHDIAAAASKTGATTVIFSVARAEGGLIRDVQSLALDAGRAFKVVPSIGELLDGRARVADVRDLRPCDLLGRRQVDIDLAPIAGYLAGKRVLVTGAGGSIGSELCRQIHNFAPSELMMLDRDESALHAVQLSIQGRALLDGADLVLADLRDVDAIRRIFSERNPQVVFHAAALKHLSLLERHPAEAFKTNVLGTQTVLEMARRVERFVNISTDKAANPASVLGYSKRLTERLTAHAATHCDGTFLSVRFGNVLGSRGSALTAFSAQAAAGGPITVTHPEVTRYFMTVQEAVQLVVQAAAIGSGGEVLVLDMGKPIRILDVAQQVARQAGRRIEIVFTGLRPGEKLHEELFATGEKDVRPYHPLISHVDAAPLHPSALRELNLAATDRQLVAALAHMAETAADRLAASATTIDDSSSQPSLVSLHSAAARSRETPRPSGETNPTRITTQI
jgi:FlaA1/EpsC-like NDP-sugar epimerase